MIQFSFLRPPHCAPPAQVLAGRKMTRAPRGLVRRGFTLIEVMVALAILSLLLVIMFVPLNLGVNMTQIGTANADTQQAAQTTMNRLVKEISSASFVFPNQRMVGITDKAPYTNNVPAGTIAAPYYEVSGTNTNACDGSGLPRIENTSRLDFLLPRIDEDPTITNRRTKGYSIVSYYARREDPTKPAANYDAETNPLGLYRARIPYKRNDGNLFPNPTNTSAPNALTDNRRYPTAANCSSDAAAYNSGARWLVQNQFGEPMLKSYDTVPPQPPPDDIDNTNLNLRTLPFSDTRITPKGVGLYAPAATPLDPIATPPSFRPETTFICEDTNGNGIIDRVTINLVMGKYDNTGSQNRAQTVKITRIVDLPNTETRFGGS